MRAVAAALFALVLLAASHQARAQELIAVQPGVMCASRDALAKLILPDGSSRSALPHPRPVDLATKFAGGCIDIPIRTRVTVLAAKKNTSVAILTDTLGPNQIYIIPNIDFREIIPWQDGTSQAQPAANPVADRPSSCPWSACRDQPDLP